MSRYEKPLNPSEPVICLDEKPVSLHAEVRPPSPATPCKIAKRDSEYKRCGTANVFCGVEPKAGRHFTFPTPDRSGPEFAKVVDVIARRYPAAQTVHLVMDNLNIHCRKSLTDYFGVEYGNRVWDRLTVHYTPSTAVGSTKPKSRSACSVGSAWASGGSRTWASFARKRRRGIDA